MMKTTAIVMSALAAIPSFAIEIPVEVPSRGYVSLQIFDSNGEVVGHAISQEPLEKGSRTVDWDMRDTIDGSKLGTGEYAYKAVLVPDHTLTYRGYFYPTPLPDGQTPWHNARSGGGGWLADHFAPKSIVRAFRGVCPSIFSCANFGRLFLKSKIAARASLQPPVDIGLTKKGT